MKRASNGKFVSSKAHLETTAQSLDFSKIKFEEPIDYKKAAEMLDQWNLINTFKSVNEDAALAKGMFIGMSFTMIVWFLCEALV